MSKGRQYHKGFSSRFYAHRVGNQVIPSGINTRVQYNGITYDILNEFDQAVLYQFMPIQAGYYNLNAQIQFPNLPVGTMTAINLYISGGLFRHNWRIHDGVTAIRQMVSHQHHLVPANWVHVEVFQNSGVNQNLLTGFNSTLLQGFRFA